MLDDRDDMFQQFGDSRQSFLDPKRAHCPHRYFISDKELITRKMSKTVDSLVLKEEPPKPVLARDNHAPPRYHSLVLRFKSVDGEYGRFHRLLKARGQVEEWVKFRDHYIKTTLTLLTRECNAKVKLK